MRKQDAIVLSLCAAVVACCVLYIFQPPAPRYYPLDHEWRWEKAPGLPSMGWYGRTLWAFLAGGVAILVTWPIAVRLAKQAHNAPSAWMPKALTFLTFVAVLAALGHTVVHEYITWMR
jgi:hypothetical protein